MADQKLEALAADELIQEAFDHVFEHGKEMTVDQFETYLECVLVVGIAAMRGHQGDDHTRGLLEGALQDLKNPAQTYAVTRRAPLTH